MSRPRSKNPVDHNVTLMVIFKITEPRHEKTCLISYANNKGAGRPAHPCSLISALVVRCLDKAIYFLT